MMPVAAREGETLPPQDIVQARLAAIQEQSGGRLDIALGELLSQSEAWGYFNHLTERNEYLSFPTADDVAPLRLQINYSRLAYRAPEGARSPACPLCFENIGVPGKEALRVFEFTLDGVAFFAHATPFPLCPGHFVVNLRHHAPMRISSDGLAQSQDFAWRAPGWLIASNSDVEWAGASVLGHHHVQVFADLRLPVEDAVAECDLAEAPGCKASILHWYCPVVRLAGPSPAVIATASRLIDGWKSVQPGVRTFNYLMRSAGDETTMHLFYRHPDYRTPAPRRSIKAEGVGIIEMAGEVIVPPIKTMSREENRVFFEREGLSIIRDIIRGNGPWEAFDAFRQQLIR